MEIFAINWRDVDGKAGGYALQWNHPNVSWTVVLQKYHTFRKFIIQQLGIIMLP